MERVGASVEQLLLCLSCVDDDGFSRLVRPLEQFVHIKLQMNPQHQIGIATFDGDQWQLRQSFSHDADRLAAEISTLSAATAEKQSTCDLSSLLSSAHAALDSMTKCADARRRLLVIHQHHTHTKCTYDSTKSQPRLHIDVIFWHNDTTVHEVAQAAFNHFCALEQKQTKAYVLDVGASNERLHQAIAVMLAHPTQRQDQDTVERLLHASSSEQ